MFGGFTLEYNGCPISVGRGGTSKVVQLLQLLLLHKGVGISKEQVSQYLYDWDTVGDRNNSLNNIIYRLKKLLIAAGLPEEEYVTLKNGICYWSGSMETYVDVAAMEQLIEEAKDQPEEKKIDLMKQACDIYKGELLPQLSSEIWVTVENLRLKKLYEETVRELCGYLNDRQEYQQTYDIYSRVASLYPYEEWQAYQIDSLLDMDRYEEAYQLYLSATRMYSDELGLPPSEAMMRRLQRMSGKLINRESNLSKVQSMINEGEPHGAYYCSYPSFVDVYRFVCRQVERSGQSVFLMMCSLRNVGGHSHWDKDAGEQLQEAIAVTLRRGDIYTRYSNTQYLILLFGARNENCDTIYKRISHNFQTRTRDPFWQVEYEVSTVVQVSMSQPELHFRKNTVSW